MTATHGKDVKLLITGSSIDTGANAGESTTEVSTDLFEIDDSTKDIWDPTGKVVVNDANGVVTDYQERYLTGRIKFNTSPTKPVTVERVSYYPTYTIANSTGISVDPTNEVANPQVHNEDAEKRINTRHDVTASIDRIEFGDLYIDDPTNNEKRYLQILLDQNLLVIEAETNVKAGTTPKFRMLGRLQNEPPEIPDSGLVNQTLEFEGSTVDEHQDNQSRAKTFRIKQ